VKSSDDPVHIFGLVRASLPFTSHGICIKDGRKTGQVFPIQILGQHTCSPPHCPKTARKLFLNFPNLFVFLLICYIVYELIYIKQIE
jgi:hypothetical protein